MLENGLNKDYRTLGYVLTRTNYGEADRILNIITPLGKKSAIAKGVRKEKSKLAGGVEIFCLSDFNFHQGRNKMAVITGAKMIRYHRNLLKDFDRMELAGKILKKINAVSEDTSNQDLFEITKQCLTGLDDGYDLRLVEAWFLLNLIRAIGEDINLYRDDKGNKLSSELCYEWDIGDSCFTERTNGGFGANEIKMLRLMVTTDLNVAARVKIDEEMTAKTLRLSYIIAKM